MSGHILVVTHKAYWMPPGDAYLPVQVGPGPDLGFARDNTGDNIAAQNANFCELTALYWAWKNLSGDFLGLTHYRRHFSGPAGDPGPGGDPSCTPPAAKRARVLAAADARALVRAHGVVLPRPRRYWIETGWSQYAHAHHEQDLRCARDAVARRCPAFLPAFDACLRRTWGHRFNMFLMRRDLADAYCAWLFDILFDVQRHLDISAYSPYDARVFGFLSERLLDVWLCGAGVEGYDAPYLFMERQGWPRKIAGFVGRKVRGRGKGRLLSF